MNTDTTTLVKPKLRTEVKDQWLAALRSGEFTQGKTELHYRVAGGERYCCLGVLCDLAVKAGVIPGATNDGAGHFYYDGAMTMPPEAVIEWAYDGPISAHCAWNVQMPEDEDEVGDKDGPATYTVSLAEVNDDRGFSFDGIADLIEQQL